jgi:hypothetical protein
MVVMRSHSEIRSKPLLEELPQTQARFHNTQRLLYAALEVLQEQPSRKEWVHSKRKRMGATKEIEKLKLSLLVLIFFPTTHTTLQLRHMLSRSRQQQ